MNIQEILTDFYDNYLKRLNLIEPIQDNFFKIICDKNNKQIFDEFLIKYPKFFDKINEMIYICDKSINEIISQKLCYCGQIKYLKNFIVGYRQYCSVKCMSLSDSVKNKKKQTTYSNYGVDNPAQSQNVRERMKTTIIEKYGVEHQMHSDEIKEKLYQTNLDKYGVKFSCQNKEIRNKAKQTIVEKYGVENYQQIHLKNLDNLNEKYIRDNFIKDGYFLVDEFCSFYNCSLTFGVVKRKEFNIKETVKTSRHKTQNSIYEWLLNFVADVINKDRNTITPKELDLYIPSHKLAIEYDGLMFHSFGKSEHNMFNNFSEEKNRSLDHLNKTEECKKRGIQLLHIFENEWMNDKSLWQSVILNKLGLNKRIFARKCVIKEIDSKIKSEFLKNNHLQNDDKSSIRIGLFFNSELVSVMTFGKSRYNKKYQYELLRFCSKQNITVVGGASKLFKYFVNKYQPKSVISYANRRWSDGNLYRQIGFKEIGITKPNYFYFNSSLELKSRIQFQKHKLSSMKFYDENLSETENMYMNGYRKIYDCGNYIFEWRSRFF